jgi:hypothetical protein
MIERDDVCRAAERFATFVAVRGDDVSLNPFFETVGLTEDTLVHMIEHLFALGVRIDDSGPFVMGALFALLAADYDGLEPQFTDADFEELLRPIP